MRRGIYILANDAVIDLAIACINSIRYYDPAIEICLIPFDRKISKINKVLNIYRIGIFNDIAILKRCDEISLKIHRKHVGHYRKLAAWFGQFDEFIYIDVDTITLAALSKVFPERKGFGFVLGHSNIATSKRFVWKENRVPCFLTPSEADFAGNTGFILSSRAVLTWKVIRVTANEACRLREYLVLECCEQSFLNLVMIRSGYSYSSLYQIGRQARRRNMPTECWAGDSRWAVDNSGSWSFAGIRKRVLFIHWAGGLIPFVGDRRCLVGAAAEREISKMKLGHIWAKFRFLEQTA